MPRSLERVRIGLLGGLAVLAVGLVLWRNGPFETLGSDVARSDREEVVFWHFWGGADQAVVDDVVARFNQSQSEFHVRAIAMPGNNLNAKLFLSVAGNDPPDLVNQDDPVLADWSARRVIVPLDEIATSAALAELNDFLLPAARRLASVDRRLVAIPNGLDIRALYYNKTVLDQHDLEPPQTIADLDRIVKVISPPGHEPRDGYAFLPDSRRLWSWGYVFGGQFFNPESNGVTVNHPANVKALEWMTQFRDWYGPDQIAAYRQGDQSLPGKAFPLLPIDPNSMRGRYVMVQDGQWRTRDLTQFQRSRNDRELPTPEFGVCPLPYPDGGRPSGGWVNGNFFVIPKGAKNPRGAMAFARFWIGLDDPHAAAETCAAGGWIPVSVEVIDDPRFQSYLRESPLFETFVQLAASENQFPYPQVAGAAFFKRTIDATVARVLATPNASATDALDEANRQIEGHLQGIQGGKHGD